MENIKNLFRTEDLKKLKRQKLKEMQTKFYANSHSMYNSYYKQKTGKNWSEIFDEHSKKFAPTLEQIVDKENKPTLKSTLKSVKKYKKFLKEDQINLFQLPYSQAARQAFYKTIEPRYPYLTKLFCYQKTLEKISDPAESLESLYHASDYYHSEPYAVANTFIDNKLNYISSHPDLDVAVELMSSHLTNVSDAQLDVLTYYSTTYEQFTLVTLEPYMVFILGNALFFKLFVPLHREGACSAFVAKAVDRQRSIRNSFYYKLTSWTSAMIEHSRPLQPILNPMIREYVSQGGFVTFTFGAAGYIYTKIRPRPPLPPTPTSTESTLARNAANNLLGDGQGLNSPHLDTARELASRAFFEAGRSVGAFSRNFFQGWLSQHDDILRDAASDVDSEITRRRNQLQLKNDG